MPYHILLVGTRTFAHFFGPVTLLVGGFVLNQAGDAPPPMAPPTVASPTNWPANVGLCSVITGFIATVGGYILRDRESSRAANLKAVTGKLLETDARAQAAEATAKALAAKVAELEAKAAQVDENTRRIDLAEDKADFSLRTLIQSGFLDAGRGRPTFAVPRPTLLIVEDDPSTSRQLRDLFTLRGFSVSVASTLEEAGRILDFLPHWMVLDLAMPDGDGLDLLRRVRSEGLRTRVAVTTGLADPGREAEVLALRPDVYLQKPIEIDDLFGKIARRDPAPLSGSPPPPPEAP